MTVIVLHNSADNHMLLLLFQEVIQMWASNAFKIELL